MWKAGTRKLDHEAQDLVRIVTQLPGPPRFSADLTKELLEAGHLGSFNVPRLPNATSYMGYHPVEGYAQYQEWSKCCRHLLIEREAPQIDSFERFKEFLRYSEYQRDPYGQFEGRPDPLCTVMTRGDTDPELRHPLHGGTSSKAARASEGECGRAGHRQADTI
jgi:hypothetical protein